MELVQLFYAPSELALCAEKGGCWAGEKPPLQNTPLTIAAEKVGAVDVPSYIHPYLRD